MTLIIIVFEMAPSSTRYYKYSIMMLNTKSIVLIFALHIKYLQL